MIFSKTILLALFWTCSLVIGVWVPMACTNTSGYFNPTSPSTPVVTSPTPTNAFGFTSTPTLTLQPTGTPTNSPTPAATMYNETNLYSPNVPNDLAVYGSPVSIYVAGGDGTFSIYSSGSLVTSFNQYNSTLFGSLSGVAIDSNNGFYYVLDSGNGAVYEFNLSTNAPITTWNNWGNGATDFNQPGGIAVDSNGYVYVADTGNQQIDVFALPPKSTGVSFVNQWGSLGQGNGEFDNPSAVCAVTVAGPATMVYVADASNQLIQIFDFNGNWKSQYSTVANSDIFGIAVDGSGNLFAADYSISNPMVEEYNSSGTLIRQWNGPGGTYFGPDGVAWFGSLLYVADYDNNAVYSLTP